MGTLTPAFEDEMTEDHEAVTDEQYARLMRQEAHAAAIDEHRAKVSALLDLAATPTTGGDHG